jgi:hypothetical protein
MPDLDPQTRQAIEAAAFRRLRQHLMQDRTDVQNIDLMNLAGFCRNCLARWQQEAAADLGITMTKDEARADYYGMPYADWVAQNQTPADAEKQAAFTEAFARNVGQEPHKG